MLRKLAIFPGIILAFGLLASAQEVRSEITVSGTGWFTKDTNNNGLQQKATESGGWQAGYRLNLNRWTAAEVNYGFTRNSQQFFIPGFSISGSNSANAILANQIQTDVHQLTADFVARVPTHGRIRPYVLAGGGALIFDPVHRTVPLMSGSMILPAGTRIPTRAQGAFVYGGGTDFDLTSRTGGKPGVALRLGYRGFVYGTPDFGFPQLDSKSMTHTAQPEAGLTFRF